MSEEKKREVNANERVRMRTARHNNDGDCRSTTGAHSKKGQKRKVNDSMDLKEFPKHVEYAVRQAKRHLHRTKHANDGNIHKAYVCIVCDCVILGTEPLRTIHRDDLRKHKHRLGVDEYQQFHGYELTDLTKRQYRVNGFPKMLLSPRSRMIGKGKWVICGHCKYSMQPRHIFKGPPKFAIANGFAIREFSNSIPDFLL